MSDVITTPGKFEGAPRYVPYYWNLAIEGEGEEFYPDAIEVGPDDWEPAGPLVSYFRVDAEESERFGLPIGSDVWLWEDSQGFVICLTDRDQVAAYFGIDRRTVVPCNVEE